MSASTIVNLPFVSGINAHSWPSTTTTILGWFRLSLRFIGASSRSGNQALQSCPVTFNDTGMGERHDSWEHRVERTLKSILETERAILKKISTGGDTGRRSGGFG